MEAATEATGGAPAVVSEAGGRDAVTSDNSAEDSRDVGGGGGDADDGEGGVDAVGGEFGIKEATEVRKEKKQSFSCWINYNLI